MKTIVGVPTHENRALPFGRLLDVVFELDSKGVKVKRVGVDKHVSRGWKEEYRKHMSIFSTETKNILLSDDGMNPCIILNIVEGRKITPLGILQIHANSGWRELEHITIDFCGSFLKGFDFPKYLYISSELQDIML